jgi:hypothetical protein
MIPIPAKQLIPGRRYYIQDQNVLSDIITNPISGKKIGTFIRYDPDIGRVFFKKLADLPGAQMRSGFGDWDRDFSDACLFFEPQSEAIRENVEQRAFKKILGKSNIGLEDPSTYKQKATVGLDNVAVEVIANNLYPNGGRRSKKQSRKRRKSKKSRPSRRSRKSKK